MKNTILKFDSREGEIDGKKYNVPDYFSKDIDVKKFFDSMPDVGSFYIFRKIDNNDKLERITFDYYENTDYWDIILMINGMDPLVSMPMEDDVILKEADDFINYFFNEYYFRDKVSITGEREKFLEEYYTQKFMELVDKNRYIKLVPPQKMPQLIDRLKKNGFI